MTKRKITKTDNNPPEEIVTYDTSKARLELLEVEAKNWLDGEPIKTQVQANTVGVLLTDIRNAKKAADGARVEEKMPHAQKAQKIQDKFNVLLKKADTMTTGCKALLAPFLAELERKQLEEATARRLEAEKAAEALREELAKGEVDKTDLEAVEVREAAEEEARLAEVIARSAAKKKAQAKVKGGVAISTRSVWDFEITSFSDVGRHYWGKRLNDKLRELIQEDINNNSRNTPGVDYTERKVAQ
jgi:hypothetical protein